MFFNFQERIRIKSLAFEQRSKEIKEKLAKISEAEQKRFSKKDDVDQSRSKFDSEDEKPAKKARKNDGEEKYDQIYSVSSSLGKFQLEFSENIEAVVWKFVKLQLSRPPRFSLKLSAKRQKENSVQRSERTHIGSPTHAPRNHWQEQGRQRFVDNSSNTTASATGISTER